MTDSEATREILWNVNYISTPILMYASFFIAILVAANGCYQRFLLWRSGAKSNDTYLSIEERLADLLTRSALQKDTIRDSAAALFHTLIYIGFLVLFVTTTVVMLHHDFGIKIYQGDFYLLLTIASDLFGLGALLGVAIASHRRYLEPSKRLHTTPADLVILSLIALLIVQGFFLEGMRISVTDDPWKQFSPVGWAVSGLFWSMSEIGIRSLHFALWWIHTITVFLFVAIIPYSKFFHILASSASQFFGRRNRPLGQVAPIGDLAKHLEDGTLDQVTLGLSTINDYSWKQRLELDACTSCGRCQEVCPAYRSDKALSPKWLILDSRNHMLTLQADGKLSSANKNSLATITDKIFLEKFLVSSGINRDSAGGWSYQDPSHRSDHQAVQTAVQNFGTAADDVIPGKVIAADVYWSCTTCLACVEACPVGINHVDVIVGSRRHLTMVEGNLPHEAQNALKNLESEGNPYGAANQRTTWAEGLDIPILKAGDSVDYLYWVGCVSAFDKRKQAIARSMVQLLKKAGVSFGILGDSEGCTGDPARRLGQELLFQTLAVQNCATLKSIKFRYLVANCPHCFNTIKNEYPEFGGIAETGQQPEIVHHSQLLKKLIAQGHLKLRGDSDQEITFHDPCYLGRYNDEYDAPRELLTGTGAKISEMGESRNKAMCCGAGGGHYWMDLKQGQRINSLRIVQASETGCGTVATGCPFCMQMLEDGAKIENLESIKVSDIAELVLEQCE